MKYKLWEGCSALQQILTGPLRMTFSHFPYSHHSHAVDWTVLPTKYADEQHSPNPLVPTLHIITFDHDQYDA